VLSEEQARTAHERSMLYTVLVGEPTRPRCFLEFSASKTVCVEHLDSALRTYFHYSFQELRPGELFVSMSRRPQFPNDPAPPDRATVLYFEVDGRLLIHWYQSNPDGIGSKLVREEERIVDVSQNWEPYPKFGDYEGLATIDRGSPWLRPGPLDI